jgi:hypothetical protein
LILLDIVVARPYAPQLDVGGCVTQLGGVVTHRAIAVCPLFCLLLMRSRFFEEYETFHFVNSMEKIRPNELNR